MSLLEVRHLCAGYGKKRILEDISFSLAPGAKILDVDHAGDIVKAENFLAGKEK